MLTPLSLPAPKLAGEARALAAGIIEEAITRGRSLSDTVPRALSRIVDPRDRGLVQELAYGVLRRYFALETLVSQLLHHPLKPRDSDIHALLLLGVYQLTFLKTPAHAAISSTVEATHVLGKPWASALVNGVLRAYQRRSEELLAALEGSAAARYAHPGWLIRLLQKAWPALWEGILWENNRKAPMTLRVNSSRVTRSQYLDRLQESGLSPVLPTHTETAIVLKDPVEVADLPGFDAGDVCVQDEAAQLAAPLLNLSSGQRVLDACAAPGGKTTHILELEPRLAGLTALDYSPARLALLHDNLKRKHLHCLAMLGDALQPETWWDGHLYHRILLDAPCSGTGVIRRHPDIKLLRRASDIDALAERQYRLLQALWPLLSPGGEFLYATCSLLPQENKLVIQRFLGIQSDARLAPIQAPWGHDTGFGRQILTGEAGMDGFFYARLYKSATP